MGIENTGRNKRVPRKNYRRRRQHVPDGFPHYTTIYSPAHCICLQACCQDWDTGCICATCPCRNGIPHSEHVLIEDVIL